MDCLRRKHHKKREHKSPRPLSAHVSPAQSQPSSVGHLANGNLPRVSSTGLWMETPGVYAVPPPQNYYYPHPHSYGMYGKEYTFPMSRAISESRLPQPGLHYTPHRSQFGNQNNVFLLPVPGQRFYHSQHLAPVYEVPPARGMEIYDYPFSVQNGGYRSKLLESRHTPEYYSNMSEFIMKPRVERSKSITEERRPSKPHPRKETPHQSTAFAQENGKLPVATNKDIHRPSWADEDRKLVKPLNGSSDGIKVHVENFKGIQPNRALPAESVMIDKTVIPFKEATPSVLQQHASTSTVSATVHSSENISSSATDSMKILAKNKTDDQKTQPSFASLLEEKNAKNVDHHDSELNLRHYIYEGSIYAVPKRNANDSDYDNPIVNRIKEMVIEKTRNGNNNTPSPVGSWKNLYEGRVSNAVKTQVSGGDNSHGVSKVVQAASTTVTGSFEPEGISANSSSQQKRTNIDVVDGLFLPDLSDLDKDYREDSSLKLAVHNMALKAHELSGLAGKSKPLNDKNIGEVSPGWSLDNDSGVDDINKAGKHLATTAFQFLDSYLSDDEGTESLVESPPLSPGAFKAGKVY